MLDVEGYELNALKGSVRTLEKFKPLIFAEDGMELDGSPRPSCISFLESFGYTPKYRSFADIVFIHKDKDNVQLT